MRKTKKKSLFDFTHNTAKLNNFELTKIFGGCCGDPDGPEPPTTTKKY